MNKTQGKARQIRECGTWYLNEYFNLTKDTATPVYIQTLNREFTSRLAQIDERNSIKISENYQNIVVLLGKILGFKDLEAQSFEIHALHINSIISSSLLIEQQINDILYNRNLLTERTSGNVKSWQGIIKLMKENIKTIEKDTSLSKEEQAKAIEQNVKALQKFEQHLVAAKQQEEQNENRIKQLKKSDYYIEKLCKNKDLHDVINTMFLYFNEVEIAETLLNELFKKYQIKITNEQTFFKEKEDKPLLQVAYKVLSQHVADLTTKALTDQSKIDSEALNQFTTIISLDDIVNTTAYKQTKRAYIKELMQNNEIETLLKGNSLRLVISRYAEKLLAELRWQAIEK